MANSSRLAEAMVQGLEGAADQREEYWENRIQPLWKSIWPKSRDLATSSISGSFARLSIAAGDKFPVALKAVRDWLRPIEHPNHIVHRLYQSGLCRRFPDLII